MLQDVRHPEIVQRLLAFLEKEDHLVTGAVMITHAYRHFIPDNRLPEFESRRFTHWLELKHALLIAHHVHVAIRLKDTVALFEPGGEPVELQHGEPFTRQSGCRADLAMFLKRWIGWVSDY